MIASPAHRSIGLRTTASLTEARQTCGDGRRDDGSRSVGRAGAASGATLGSADRRDGGHSGCEPQSWTCRGSDIDHEHGARGLGRRLELTSEVRRVASGMDQFDDVTTELSWKGWACAGHRSTLWKSLKGSTRPGQHHARAARAGARQLSGPGVGGQDGPYSLGVAASRASTSGCAYQSLIQVKPDPSSAGATSLGLPMSARGERKMARQSIGVPEAFGR
jgi:hypothetical protein